MREAAWIAAFKFLYTKVNFEPNLKQFGLESNSNTFIIKCNENLEAWFIFLKLRNSWNVDICQEIYFRYISTTSEFT